MNRKPPKLGTIWPVAARIQAIDLATEPPRWKTLATCLDTPNAVRAALAEQQAAHPSATLWVDSPSRGGRYLP